MRQTVTKNTLEPFDMVEHDGTAYIMQAIIPGRPCASQCHLYDHDKERCPGICYRWDNAEEIVFRKMLPVELVTDGIPFVVTDTWDRYHAILRADKNERLKEYRAGTRGPKKGEGGRKPKGGIIWDAVNNRWRASIRVKGVPAYRTSRDKGVVERWLEEKRRELGIETDDTNVADDKKKRGRKLTGCVEIRRGSSYRASIIIDGKLYRYSSADKSEVDAWLEKMKEGVER